MISADNKKKHLHIDTEIKGAFFAFLEQELGVKKKFNHNVKIILNSQPTQDIFRKEQIDEKSRHIYAIKLHLPKKNTRIYCSTQENKQGLHIIIADFVEHKDSQKLSPKLKNIIQRIAEYEYEL